MGKMTGLLRIPGKRLWSHFLTLDDEQCLKHTGRELSVRAWEYESWQPRDSRSSSPKDSSFPPRGHLQKNLQYPGFLNNFLNIRAQNIYRTPASCTAVFLPAQKFCGSKANLKGVLVLPGVRTSPQCKKQNSDLKIALLGTPGGSIWSAMTRPTDAPIHLCINSRHSMPCLHVVGPQETYFIVISSTTKARDMQSFTCFYYQSHKLTSSPHPPCPVPTPVISEVASPQEPPPASGLGGDEHQSRKTCFEGHGQCWRGAGSSRAPPKTSVLSGHLHGWNPPQPYSATILHLS